MDDKLVCVFYEFYMKSGVNRVIADMSFYLKDKLFIFTPKYNPSVYELNSRVFEVSINNIWKMSRIIKNEKKDVILNPQGFDNIIPIALVKLLLFNRKTRLSPFIYDSTELEFSFPKKSEIVTKYPKIRFLKFLYDRSKIIFMEYPKFLFKITFVRLLIKLKIIDEILVLDNNMANLVRDKLNCKNVEVVRIGVSPSFFGLIENDKLESSARLKKIIDHKKGTKVFFQGILIPRRRLEDLIEAISALIKENVDVYLLVGGSLEFDQLYVNNIKNLVDELNLNDYVCFLDTLSDDELIFLYRECDIFVFPNNNQTWGLAPLEAMLFKKPVIVSSGCGVSEVLNEEVALLVPPMDPSAIKNAIIKLIKDEDLNKEIGDNAREHVIKNYTFLNTIEKLKALWNI